MKRKLSLGLVAVAAAFVTLLAGPGPSIRAQPVANITLPPPGSTEQLYSGCNPIALTFPDGTPSQTVVQAVTPAGSVEALWRFDAAQKTWKAFSPAAPQASDLLQVDFLDAVWLCMAATSGFEGTRGPVESPGTATGRAILVDVRTGRHAGFDRIAFEFEDALPGYRIEYVEAPTSDCAGGLPIEITGLAFLQASFPTAGWHGTTRESTFGLNELVPNLPTLIEAERTCDFEGVLTWVLGLSEEVDFRVHELEGPYRVVIDVRHP